MSDQTYYKVNAIMVNLPAGYDQRVVELLLRPALLNGMEWTVDYGHTVLRIDGYGRMMQSQVRTEDFHSPMKRLADSFPDADLEVGIKRSDGLPMAWFFGPHKSFMYIQHLLAKVQGELSQCKNTLRELRRVTDELWKEKRNDG